VEHALNASVLTPARRTAILVVDVQNDFCDPAGATARSGKSVQPVVEMVPRLARFLEAGRRAGARVIFVQMLQTPWTDSEVWLNRIGGGRRVDKCAIGTWGAEFYGVAPREGEPIVVKHRYSAFINTSLEPILHTWGIETLIMTGVTTNTCVESTARDGFQRDYNIVMVSDCVAAYAQPPHDAALENIAARFGQVATSDEIADAWAAKPAAV
jgi:ureidoacrylate peracid hydrolase